jgi:putative flavoprotein involved in K+ transport
VVIAATGYRSSLPGLVGHLGLVDDRGRPRVHGPRQDPRYPGLRFVGFRLPISGNLRELRHEARRVAGAVSCDLVAGPAGRALRCWPWRLAAPRHAP